LSSDDGSCFVGVHSFTDESKDHRLPEST